MSDSPGTKTTEKQDSRPSPEINKRRLPCSGDWVLRRAAHRVSFRFGVKYYDRSVKTLSLWLIGRHSDLIKADEKLTLEAYFMHKICKEIVNDITDAFSLF